jgi:hypothetical protein
MIGGELTIRASAGLYGLDRTTVLSWLIPPLTHYCGVGKLGGPKMDLSTILARSGKQFGAE